jgi:predicted HD phosphohydrolase
MENEIGNNEFLARSAKKAAAEANPQMSPTAKADLLETVMLGELEVKIAKSWICNVVPRNQRIGPAQGRHLMGDDPRLPKMPETPGLVDFFKYRVCRNLNGSSHLLQSANLAREKGLPEKIILACLLHDISVAALIRVDHGYWAAQLVAPYVDEETAWAIQHHQALRYFAAPDYGYDYPKFYKEVFGEDYVPEPYIQQAAQQARKHRWYDSAMQVVVNDLYAFDPNKRVDIEEFTDIIGRNFKQPEQGLGFDNSPSAHMWRTMIWPNNFL